MNHWEGPIIGASSSKIRESLGLTNSLHDRDIWQQFLRLSKDFHENLTEVDNACAWSSMTPAAKNLVRTQLKEVCSRQGIFAGVEVDPAIEWRLYQLQRNKRAEMRRPKQVEELKELPKSSQPIQSGSERKVGQYDPVRDMIR